MVVIDERNTQALFNFLVCDSQQLVATVGPQAGLPPSILAPIAFCGATLRSVKVRTMCYIFVHVLVIVLKLYLMCIDQ